MERTETGDYEMVNLLKEEELLKWRKYVEQCIESADRAFQLHMMICLQWL